MTGSLIGDSLDVTAQGDLFGRPLPLNSLFQRVNVLGSGIAPNNPARDGRWPFHRDAQLSDYWRVIDGFHLMGTDGFRVSGSSLYCFSDFFELEALHPPEVQP